MKAEHAHIWWGSNGLSSTATINVSGLGNVEIRNFISDDTRNRVEQEAILSLQQRLGIVCSFNDAAVKGEGK